MLTYKLSSGETLGVSAGKLWTRITLFDTNGKQYYQDKYYTPLINLSTIRNFIEVVSDDTRLTDTIVSYIKKAMEQ
jgi:hypothetical protein